jgi:Protein of unknown function (DUF1097)
MNASTARALLVGLLVALWVWLRVEARLNVSMAAPLVALGCFYAAGGGVSGLQKTLLGTLSGVVWVLLGAAASEAVRGTVLVAALITGLMAIGIVLVSRVPLLSFTGGAFAGAGVALLLGVNTVTEGIRVAIALAIGALIGFGAEKLAGMIAARRA